MDLAVTIGIVLLLLVVSLVGVALTLLTFSGAWLILLTAMVVQYFQPGTFHTITLVVVAVLTLSGDVLEFASSGITARRAGASKRAGRWSIVGGIVGAILGSFLVPIPILGTLVGAAVGAGLGASAVHHSEGYTLGEVSRVGAAALSGRLAATLVKCALTVVVGAIVVVAAAIP